LVREFMCELLWNKNIHGEKPKDFSVGVGNSSFLMEEFKKSKQQNTIQKDWEIMSFMYQDRIVMDKDEEGRFGVPDFCVYEEDLIRSPLHKIHSVKRISDGKVFSIGDVIDEKTICEFEVNEDWSGGMFVSFYGSKNKSSISWLPKKVKQPLFKTEDGIDVYEGDRYYVVIEKDGFGYETFAVAWHGQGGIESANYKNAAKFFSDKEKANEYILMNKPVLSVNDVISKIRRCCDGAFSENTDGWDFTDKVSDLVKQVQELAKSKIEGK